MNTSLERWALCAFIATQVVVSPGTSMAEDGDCLSGCALIQTYPARPGGNPFANALADLGVVTESPFCFALRAPHNGWFQTQASPGTLRVDICDVTGGVGSVAVQLRLAPDWPAGILGFFEFRRPKGGDSWTVELTADDFGGLNPCDDPLVVLFYSSGGGVMTFKVSFTAAECL